MARNVNITIDPKTTLHILTIKKSGSVIEKTINIDDMVTDLRYTEEGKINKITGRVSDIALDIVPSKRSYTSIGKAKSWFKVDVTPTVISIDASTEYHSNVKYIKLKDILEDDGVLDVKNISFYLSYGFSGEVLRSDNSVNKFEVKEGDVLTNLTYSFWGEEYTIESSKIIAITRDGASLMPSILVLNYNNVIRHLAVGDLVNIEKTSLPLKETECITSMIDPNIEKNYIYMDHGVFPDVLEISGEVIIKGNKCGVWGSSKNRDQATYDKETILTGPIKATKGSKLTIDGCVLTKNALIHVEGGCEELVIQNCIIKDLIPNSTRSSFIKGMSVEPTKITINNCYFGNNQVVDTYSIHNLFDFNFPLVDGSIINHNYFAKEANTHNFINIYGVVDEATIDISDNMFEYSATAIRIGTAGDAKCTINITNLEYHGTDESDEGRWAGMMLIQPYSSETVTMENMRINLNNIKHRDKYQLYFMYSANKEGYCVLTEENAPKVYVNNELYPRLFNHIMGQ